MDLQVQSRLKEEHKSGCINEKLGQNELHSSGWMCNSLVYCMANIKSYESSPSLRLC